MRVTASESASPGGREHERAIADLRDTPTDDEQAAVDLPPEVKLQALEAIRYRQAVDSPGPGPIRVCRAG